MTKTLLVPDHIAEKERKAKSFASAYVNKDERVLDPTLVSKSLRERLPQPTGWRLLVMPYMGKATTDGGIHIPDAVRDREALSTVVAYVLKAGPLAYNDRLKFGKEEGETRRTPNPWCQEVTGCA